MAIKMAVFLGFWFGITAAVLINTPAKGTDSSRFSDQLKEIYSEVFYWHESMYIMGPAIEWKPDWHWYMDLQWKIEKFQTELDRAPDSPCANKARAIVISDWPWLATNPVDIAGVERRWKETMDKLPLTCGEF